MLTRFRYNGIEKVITLSKSDIIPIDFQHNMYTFIISIRNTGDEQELHFCNCIEDNVLIQHYDDIDFERYPKLKEYEKDLEPFDITLANQVYDFILTKIPNFKTDKSIIYVHCGAGVSRSKGIGAAISKFYFDDDEVFFKGRPNAYVYHTALNAFMNRKEQSNKNGDI